MSAIVSLNFPHVLPTSVHFVPVLKFAIDILGVWVECQHRSKVTPRIFGFLLMGFGTLAMLMSRTVLTSFVQSVKSVAEHLPGESC